MTTRECRALHDVHLRERWHHDEIAAELNPAAMPPRPPDEWERALLDAAGDVAGREVLEIGCGEGGLSLALLARGARLTATDLSPGMVSVARERTERFRAGAPARFMAAPVEALGLDAGRFDLVIGKFILHHLELGLAVDELRRVLRADGRGLFMETSGLNPALGWARRHLVGRFGVHRYGTHDEHPLARRDLERMTASFGRVRARFPVFWLLQMLERQWLRHHWPAAAPLTRTADDFLAAHMPRLVPYGYFMLVELEYPLPR